MDKYLSIYWFVIIFITAGAIIYMVSGFYSYPQDVRELEADILSNNIADCISQGGRLNSILVNENGTFNEYFSSNFLQECPINLNSNDNDWKDDQYYFKVEFFKLEDTVNPVFSIEKGNLNLISSCELQKEKEYKTLAKCVEKRFYSVADTQYLIKILSAVRKTEKNVKQ